MVRNKHLVKMDDLRNVDTIDLIAKLNKKKKKALVKGDAVAGEMSCGKGNFDSLKRTCLKM